jgi:hypothetical protein
MPKTKKPIIPEPSPRFALWSAIVGVVLIVGVVAFEYGVGVARTPSTSAPTHLAKDQKHKS